MKAVGIDLAGTEHRPTGMCLMDGELKVSTCLLYGDQEIIHWTVLSRPDVVAIDAPLALPRGRESLETRNDVHFRECDRQLRKLGIKFFPITLGPMRRLTARGISLKRRLENLGLRVVETYPGAAQDLLHIPRKGKGLAGLASGLRLAGVQELNDRLTADELDAVTCALVGIMYLKGEYQAIGDPDEILMVLPARRTEYDTRAW